MTAPAKRCINLDWLEVYCLEIAPRTPQYFTDRGYEVRVRAYGTPQYAQMFTIYDGKFPMIEIRRNPYSLRKQGGIFPDNACHIRLSNRACYLISPVRYLYNFMLAHGFRYQSISRIDIALDFNNFDDGTDPADFIGRYMRNEISKINQCNIHSHGSDHWNGRTWNSLKWGAPTSAVSTKLYNKTLELKEGKDKFYIRDAWAEASLDITRDVWRIEFSINSQSQTLKDKQTGGYIKKSISDYETRFQLLFHWEVLASKYFHFKERVGDKRKDRCPDIATIVITDPDAETYRPVRNPTEQHEPGRTTKMLFKALMAIYEDDTEDYKIRQEAHHLATTIVYRNRIGQAQLKAAETRQAEKRDNLLLSPEHTAEYQIAHNRDLQARKELALLRHLLARYNAGLIPDPENQVLPF